MKIIEPSVELLIQEDAKSHVAKCARICYGRESGNDDATISNLITNKHWSMFRHESVYSMIPIHYRELKELYFCYLNCPYINMHLFDGYLYISTNRNFIIDNEDYPFIKLIKQFEVDKDKFISIEEHRQITMPMLRYTFKVTTQISTSRELNRVSPNNISERSTRYVYENGTICRPHWISTEESKLYNDNKIELLDIGIADYLNSCCDSFVNYKYLIDKHHLHRQDARGVLPIDTATVCAYTYSWREWEEIIKKRVYNTTGKSHPNATIICKLIEQELNTLGYEVKL